jgi:hypothetical protein
MADRCFETVAQISGNDYNKSFEKVAQFKCLGTASGEVKSRLD